MFWADPSGADSSTTIMDLFYSAGSGATTYTMGSGNSVTQTGYVGTGETIDPYQGPEQDASQAGGGGGNWFSRLWNSIFGGGQKSTVTTEKMSFNYINDLGVPLAELTGDARIIRKQLEVHEETKGTSYQWAAIAAAVLREDKFVNGGLITSMGVGSSAPKGRLHSVQTLTNIADEAAEGLSPAGRALQKHGSRANSVFPAARGNYSVINAQGSEVMEGILTNPGSIETVRHHARFGEILEYRAPNGYGVRFNSTGTFFIGFIEP